MYVLWNKQQNQIIKPLLHTLTQLLKAQNKCRYIYDIYYVPFLILFLVPKKKKGRKRKCIQCRKYKRERTTEQQQHLPRPHTKQTHINTWIRHMCKPCKTFLYFFKNSVSLSRHIYIDIAAVYIYIYITIIICAALLLLRNVCENKKQNKIYKKNKNEM